MPAERVVINGKEYVVLDELQPWWNRVEKAEKSSSDYLAQIRINRMFAAGKQHLDLNERDGRVVEVKTRNGIELVTSNFLDQYLNTVQGRLTSNDYKPNFLVAQEDNPVADEVAKAMNLGFSWGWDNEWNGDEAVNNIVRHLITDGTVLVRSRYDRRYGEIVGDVPYRDGTPILDDEEQRKYVAEKASNGETATIRTLREGKCVWEIYDAERFLVPPGHTDPATFPWDCLRRPVPVMEVKNRYGKLADDVVAEKIENTTAITAGPTVHSHAEELDDHVMVYTGFVRPNAEYPEGCRVVFTKTSLLDISHTLPLPDHPLGPRTGLHYFRWQVVPGRFWGKAFIENGIGPQKLYNKRHTQINAIIDRNMPKVFIEEHSVSLPKTGAPMEVVPVRVGAPLPKADQGVAPGAWLNEDIKMQVEAVERALGVRGISMGQAPQGVAAYSAMALLTENDALKLDPIAQDFGLEMDELCWDTMENMRNWPKGKKLDILGPNNQLENFTWQSNTIPERYLLKRMREGSLPRSQAAEIQKINDIWTASAGQLPLTWYIDSLNAGKAQELPPSIGDADAHKAELENLLINQGQVPPVAPYDNHLKHVESHRASQSQAQSRVDMGDETALETVANFDAHIQEHEGMAQANAPAIAPPQGVMMPQAPAPQPDLGPGPVPGIGGNF